MQWLCPRGDREMLWLCPRGIGRIRTIGSTRLGLLEFRFDGSNVGKIIVVIPVDSY